MTWPEYTVAQLTEAGVLLVEDGNHGEHRPRPAEFSAIGTAFIRAADLNGGAVQFESAERITDTALRRIRKGIGQPLDVILSHKGTVGKVALAPSTSPPFVCSPQTTFWRSRDSKQLLPNYLFGYLRSPLLQNQLASLAGSTDMAPYVSLTQQRGLRVKLPPISTQRAIAQALGALDNKVTANDVVIAVADQLRRVRYEAMLGAGVEPLSELARFVNGRAYTNGATGTGRVVIRIADLNSGLGGSTVYNDIEVPDDNIARPGDLLFAWSGSLTAARWYRSEAIVNQHIFKVIPKAGWPMWVVATAIHRKLDDFKAIAADKATTMGHIQRHHLDQLVMVPDQEQIAKHNSVMTALWDRALAAEIESLELAALRDTLLPNLMSGRTTVREAEERVEKSL